LKDPGSPYLGKKEKRSENLIRNASSIIRFSRVEIFVSFERDKDKKILNFLNFAFQTFYL
jgi:hypothetical protein